MAFTYTPADLVTWLKADMSYDNTWPWVIDRLRNSGHKFTVEYLIGRDFDGGEKYASVSTGAKNQIEAVSWAKDAIREWAGSGIEAAGNYFPLIARDYAINGPGKGNTAKSLATTLDFLILMSKFGSTKSNNDMLETNAILGKDVPEIYCYIYANKYSPSDKLRKTEAKVNIEGPKGGGPPGLDPQYWDSVNGTHTDQTHHFAAYFCFGASHGFHKGELHTALSATDDWSIVHQKVTNQGDYDLGFVGAKWGASFKSKPRYIGSEVETALTSKDTAVEDPVPEKK